VIYTCYNHFTPLKEIKARPNLDILTEYQKWVDEQSDLVDAIMGMYQVDTSPENVDLEDDEEEEPMFMWVNSLTIWKEQSCLGCIHKGFSRTISFSSTLPENVCLCVSTCCLCLCLCPHCVVNVLRLESHLTFNTSNWISFFFPSHIPSVTVCPCVLLSTGNQLP